MGCTEKEATNPFENPELKSIDYELQRYRMILFYGNVGFIGNGEFNIKNKDFSLSHLNTLLKTDLTLLRKNDFKGLHNNLDRAFLKLPDNFDLVYADYWPLTDLDIRAISLFINSAYPKLESHEFSINSLIGKNIKFSKAIDHQFQTTDEIRILGNSTIQTKSKNSMGWKMTSEGNIQLQNHNATVDFFMYLGKNSPTLVGVDKKDPKYTYYLTPS